MAPLGCSLYSELTNGRDPVEAGSEPASFPRLVTPARCPTWLPNYTGVLVLGTPLVFVSAKIKLLTVDCRLPS